MKRATLALALLATPLSAQSEVDLGQGAVLRALDKVSGAVTDIDMRNASSARFGRITINLGECRYPSGNPGGDAYAFLTIQEDGQNQPQFSGWMVASSPALNGLDHPRYDVWVMRCKTEA